MRKQFQLRTGLHTTFQGRRPQNLWQFVNWWFVGQILLQIKFCLACTVLLAVLLILTSMSQQHCIAEMFHSLIQNISSKMNTHSGLCVKNVTYPNIQLNIHICCFPPTQYNYNIHLACLLTESSLTSLLQIFTFQIGLVPFSEGITIIGQGVNILLDNFKVKSIN